MQRMVIRACIRLAYVAYSIYRLDTWAYLLRNRACHVIAFSLNIQHVHHNHIDVSGGAFAKLFSHRSLWSH